MTEEFDHFFITELRQIEELYIPKLEGKKMDFVFDIDNPFESPSSPRIKEFRNPLLNCLKCWQLFNYGEDYEKEPIPCRDFKKGDIVRFQINKISKYISDIEFKNIVKGFIINESKNYYNKFEVLLSSKNTDANQKRLINIIFDKAEYSITALLNCKLNKYNKVIADVLIREYILFIEKIITSNEEIFPDFLKNKELRIKNLRELYERYFGFINELDKYIYPDYHQKFLEFEEKLVPEFLTSRKSWNRSINDLVRYYLFLNSLNFFKDKFNTPHLHILNFLGDRYNIQFYKQTNPNRIAKLSINGLYDFLK